MGLCESGPHKKEGKTIGADKDTYPEKETGPSSGFDKGNGEDKI